MPRFVTISVMLRGVTILLDRPRPDHGDTPRNP